MKSFKILVFLTSLFFVTSSVMARSGLGALFGVVMPVGNDKSYEIAESMGMFVDIPLYSSFHIESYSSISKFDAKKGGAYYLSDTGLSFLFMVRTRPIKPFFGVTAGISPYFDELRFDAGLKAGFYFHIISNFYLVANGRYSIAIGEPNIKRLTLTCGIKLNL